MRFAPGLRSRLQRMLLGSPTLGPMLVAGFAAYEFRRAGPFVTAAGTYVTLVVSVVWVALWRRRRLRVARRQLAEDRRRRSDDRGGD